MKAFNGIPFFRIIIPFIIGILVGINFGLRSPGFLVFVFFVLLLFILKYYKAGNYNKWVFLITADVLLCLLGISNVHLQDLSRQSRYYGNQVNTDTLVTCITVINDLPVKKTKFVKCELKLLEIRSGSAFQKTKGTLIAYFKHASRTSLLTAGQVVMIKGNLVELTPPKNPYEFDYKSYLFHKQIYHTVFLDSSSYLTLPVKGQLSLVWEFGLRCKAFVLKRLKESELSENAYGICAALLTGYDDEIDKSVMEAFSHSGTLHVLSVSGLHTGLIYLALNFIFNFFDRKKKYKLSRFVFITLFLWFFALITGFSAPVLRAVIMFNLLGLGKIYFRAGYAHQLNILLVSAFILLVYNPFYISDIGFLLSYFALFGLIYFQPKLTAMWQPGNKLTDAVWQSVTASVAATISTLPITLFCFKQFPLWFFVCNMVVVPATFLLLLLAVGVVFKIKGIALLINYLISGLVWFINLFNSGRFGFIDAIHFTGTDVLFLSLFIVLLAVAFQYRSYKNFRLSLVVMLVWQLTALLESFIAKDHSLLTVYNIKGKGVVSVKNKTGTYLTQLSASDYNFSVKPHLTSFNYPEVWPAHFNIVKTDKHCVLWLDHPGFWPDMDFKNVTIAILSNNFKLSKRDFLKLGNLKTLVLDASNNSYTAARTEELSRNFGINFYNTKNKGAYILAFQ